MIRISSHHLYLSDIHTNAHTYIHKPPHLKSNLTHLLYPVGGDVLLGGKDMRLVIGLHTEGSHVLFGAGLGDSGQDADALGQADDLLVQLLGIGWFLTPAAATVVELQASDAILAGRV